jgi:ABC-2 type transport system ATP-binding protein
MSGMEVVLEDVTKVYGGHTEAISHVNLRISTGTYGLLGPNGAGKTTLMRILAGILRPTSGKVVADGLDCSTEAGRANIKRQLGYLPQDLGLYPDLTARQFLDYIGILKGLGDKKGRHRRIEELLEVVKLEQAADRKVGGFSGGMKRRVGIAQALLNDPRLLIVDEPTAGLDPEERVRFRNVLSDLAKTRTVLLSTHIVEDVAQSGRDLAVLYQGRVIYEGTAAGLIARAEGKVWSVRTNGPKPEGDVTVVSTLHLGDSVQYRVVGEPSGGRDLVQVVPSLEDGYMLLMQGQARSEALLGIPPG